jgi:hypothetical protein
MAVNITATRTSTLFNDQDGDGLFDPGDVVLTRIRITNLGTTDATGISVTDTLSGVTLVPGSVEVTPIAFDDFMPSIVGNTPITFTAAQLLGNDVDPDGAEINLTISGVSNASHGAIVNNGDGTFTFTPTTGYAGSGLNAASFEYTITDEQGRGSVTTGIVKFDVTDPVWYVNNATGSDITGDGSWAKPFASLVPLNTGGSADALDNADDTIFVYNAGTYANASIVLETNQKLFGDGHAFSVNGLSIGANANNTTLSHAGAAITLASGNTIDGLDLVGTATAAVGIQDGGVAAGTVTVTGTSITGQGQVLDIDQGGTLAVTLTNIASTGSTGANGGVIDLTGVGGTLTVSGTTTINGTHSQAGIDISGNSGLTVDFQGNVVVNTGANTAVNITSNTGTNSITFSGASKDIDTTTATAVNITGNTTSTTVGFTNGGLDIDSTTGAGLNMDATTLNVTGGTNTINTTTGQILSLVNSQMGTGGIAFTTLGSGTVAAGNAININNLDAAGAGTFSGGAVTVGGTGAASADAINITASNSTFGFASATIGSTAVGNFVAGDGIEINGTTPNLTGAVTFTTVNINGVSGVGVNIVGATNAVNINGGNIGGTNDSGGDGVNINGGTGAVTVAATVTKTTLGNEVVDISSHATGAISFTGAVSSNSGGGGIRIVNNTSGNIGFTGDVSLSTGTLAGLTFTNTVGTGANVTFSGGTTDITTTSGTGINATNSTIGAGSLTISGASNTVAASTGRAINVDGVTLNATLLSLGVSGGGTTTGVWLQNTGGAGQFIVTGTGSTAGSGGTITNIGGADAGSITAQPTTGTGIYMNNVSNVSLSNMIFGQVGGTMNNFGIRGDNVNNFTLTDSEFRGVFGTNFNFDEATIRFGSQNVTTGLTGTALFQGNNIAGGIEDNLAVYVYGSNSLNITVKDSANDAAVFGLNDTTNGNDGFYLESGGTSNVTVLVDGVAFNGARGDLMQVLSTGSTHQTITIQNNQFINAHTNIISGGGGLAITGGGTNIDIDYLVNNNTFKGMRASAIFSSYGGVSGTISGLITNNTMGTPNGVYDTSQANRGSMEGMFFFGGVDAKQLGSTGNVNYALRIEGNTIRDVNGIGGIFIRSNQQDSGGQARVEATIASNTMAEMGPNLAGGIYLQPGGASLNNDKGTIGANISNNNINFTIGGASATADAVVFDQASTIATFYMPGYTNAPSADPNTLATFLKNVKGNVFTNAQVSGTGGVLANTSAVQNQAFTLAIPSAMAPGFSQGWEDLAVSPVGPPPRDPDPTPDVSDGGGNGGSGGTGGGSGGGTGGGGGGSGDPPPTVVDDGIITLADLSYLVDAAIQRWVDAGATAAQVDAMRAVQFGVVDMAGIYVGTSNDGVINIDADGAGYGWFVDSTPGEDSEFDGSGTRLTADAGGAADGRLDLLTVLMHELGHQIGLGDEYVTSQGDDVMFGYMQVGERRLPSHGEADGAVPGSVGATAFALTPVSIGTLPSNKTVDVYFKATIDLQADKFIGPLMNTATISGSNFANVLAIENNALDSLTLGSTVYVDANLNGLFDAGEGRTGVALELYADTNDSGGWDIGDVLLGSTTTGALGAYSFAGLAPGDYIVVVTAANFANGAQLDDLLIVQGVAADPDNNVDNDNNGVAATGGAVASQTITLAYNTEPTAGTGNDTNNTLDFGFVANQPPVANDDSVTVDEDSGSNDLTAQLLGNDTDPENDTRTITGKTDAAHGTVSVSGGVLTYQPNGNYNGTDTFTYTISDGNGHTDTATVNVTVTAVNDPVTGTAPANASVDEDSANVAITGMSISDVDATLAPAGVYDVTLSATHGKLTLTTISGLTFGTGDGTDDTTMTFHGTLAAINTALATAKYTPDSNYNGPAQIDLQVTDTFSGIVATGTGLATNDTDSIAVTVTGVNDTPILTVADNGTSTEQVAGKIDAAASISDLDLDALNGGSGNYAGTTLTVSNNAGANANDLFGFAASGAFAVNGSNLESGGQVFATFTGGNGSALGISFTGSGTTATTALVNAVLQSVQYTYTGDTPPAAVDILVGFNDGAPGNAGQGSIASNPATDSEVIHLVITDTSENSAPAVDLDASGGGTGFASSYTEGGAPAAISDTDVLITDADSGDDIVSATITITNAETGDKLNVGTLPATVSKDPSSTDTVVKLVAAAGTSAADFEAAIEAVTYSSSSADPTDHGTNLSRTITVTVNDGDLDSVAATATVGVTDVNNAPTGTSSAIMATEDAFRVLSATDLGFNDVDGTLGSVTISAVSGGKIYFDADGAGGNDPVEAVLPHMYTALQLSDGLVSFKANQDLNGTNVATITFTVTDDDGADAGGSNVLNVSVTAVNDSPVLTTGGPVPATEQTAVPILTGASVADVDLDARNGGNGDYAGASFSVNRNPATNPTEDVFTLVAGPNFTIDGSNNLMAGGQIFGTISVDGSAGLIVINFTSLETAATSALVDEVIQSVRYTNTSNNPPASVDLAIGFDDGSPGGGQGSGATDLDINLVTVNIAAVNDPPVVTAADTTVSGTEDVNLVFNAANGNAITVADADTSTLTVTLTVLSGRLTLSQTTGLSVTGDGTATVELTGSAANINAALEGLIYRGNLNYEGSDTLGIVVNDGTDTDTENVAITLADDGLIHGDSGDNTLYGTPQTDDFRLQQGGNDTVFGLGSDDVFYFGSAFTGADKVDGGDGTDGVTLQGNYTLTLSATNLTHVEALSLQSGARTKWGDTSNAFYNYNITTDNANVAPGEQLTVNGQSLRAGENFTFDGSAEMDGRFLVFGGHGVDTLKGGAGSDVFSFGGDRWGAGDSVDGGGGRDGVTISAGNGLTHINFGATSLINIEALSVNNRYAPDPTAKPSYEFVLHTGNVTAGGSLIVNGGSLVDPTQTFSVDGTAVGVGKSLIIIGGAGSDVLRGGAGNDVITGGLNPDTMTGGGGNDIFKYDSAQDSTTGGRDGIGDFNLGDILDLSGVDADSTLAGNQAFTFIGSGLFTNQAGQLRAIHTGGGIWEVSGDTDGVGGADFQFTVTLIDHPVHSLTAADFIL